MLFKCPFPRIHACLAPEGIVPQFRCFSPIIGSTALFEVKPVRDRLISFAHPFCVGNLALDVLVAVRMGVDVDGEWNAQTLALCHIVEGIFIVL